MRTRRVMIALAVCGLVSLGRCTSNGPNGNDGGGEPEPTVFQRSPDGRFVAIVDGPGFDEFVARSELEPRPTLQPMVEAYINAYAAHFGSDADFLLFTIDTPRMNLRFSALGGFNVTVGAPETGLGPIGFRDGFESFPNLRSFVYLARKDSLVLGPSLHELAHAWGVRLAGPATLAKQVVCSDNHWGFSSAGGQLGGWLPGSLQELSPGVFELSRGNIEPNGRSFNTVPYSNIELYLMGMAEAEEVEPLEVAVDATLDNLFRFEAAGMAEVSIEQIISTNGIRRPTPDQSQRTFKVVLVILVGAELTDEEWRFYEDSVSFFEAQRAADINAFFPPERYRGTGIREFIESSDPEDRTRRFINFFEATLGRATLEFVAPDVR